MQQARAQNQELRLVTQIRQDTERRLAALNLAPLEPIMAEKFPNPGQLAAGQLQVSTNVYGLQLKQNPVFRYQVTIEGILVPMEGRERKPIAFTGNVRGDPVCVSRRDDCRKIFLKTLETYRNDFKHPREHYFYDLKSILFTLEQLPIVDKKQYELGTAPDFYTHCQKIVVTVQKVTEKFQLTTGDIRTYVSPDLGQVDRSLQQFLEIAVSQPILFDPENHVVINGGSTYFMDPTKFGFSDRDTPALREGKYLAVGAQKSVRFVEGPRGRGFNNASVIVNPKKTPFHNAQPLIDKVAEMVRLGRDGRVERYDIENLRKGLKGLFVQSTHREVSRIMRIVDIIDETARNSIIPGNEKVGEISIENYFQRTYGIVLKYPEAPLVGIRVPRYREGVMKFPIEVLKVVDNQRVTTEQQSREQIAQQIRACAVLPSLQKEQIQKCANAIHLFNNPNLDAVGIKVVPNPLTTNARMLPQPAIVYGGGTQPINPDNRGTWQGGVGRGPQAQSYKFLIPASCNKWEAYLIDPHARDAIDQATMTEFLKRLATEARRRGMQIGAPATISTVAANEKALKAVLDKAIQTRMEFVFFIHAGRDTHLHGLMKYFELNGIITQDLKAQTASNVVSKGQNQTMENIVMKTNMKLGGLNHAVTISNPELVRMLGKEVLYIGFGTNHPGGGLGEIGLLKKRSKLGFAANDNPHPFEFTGDYVFQETRRDEKVDVMKDIITKILDRYIKNRNAAPKCVIIYRNGCSEGQFGDVIFGVIFFN
uniref:Piwi domain-containing protein n=1 Tax=Acrobeloides nanus TaxID=290746 RepID=A0A914BXC5_9BILA